MQALDEIGEFLQTLARGAAVDLEHLFASFDIQIAEGTGTTLRCHYVKADPNRRPMLREFIQVVSNCILEYAIPRPEIDEAFKLYQECNATTKVAALFSIARRLFTDIDKSGEGGELLLFVLVERILGYPQIIPKMSLKTDAQMHFHGADGVFLSVKDDLLNLHFGESKLYEDATDALRACLTSIQPFFEYDPSVDRDFELLHFIDLNDPAYESAVKRYMNYGNPEYGQLRVNAVCLVGYDYGVYADAGGRIADEEFEVRLEEELARRVGYVREKVVELGMQHCEIQLFILPLTSVQEYRLLHKQTLGLGA